MQQDPWLSIDDLVERLGVSLWTVFRYMEFELLHRAYRSLRADGVTVEAVTQAR